MVQADHTRDYYKDLGLPPNCDESDIRKAFRQLALKYHPDRNPGREAEFVTKFQQIQAAHEILSDKAARTKYDQARRRYRPTVPSYGSATRPAPPPARNTYTASTPSGTYYKANPPRPAPQQHHSTFANGAERFTSKNFRAPPTAQRPSARPTPEEKANVFTAWQKMKQPQGEEKRHKEQNPNNPNGAPFGRSKSARTPSMKKGFDPKTPGADEGPARGSYRSSYERPNPSVPATADPFDNVDTSKTSYDSYPDAPFAEANRVRTPYFSKAGERTSMFGESVSRSASTRNSPRDSPTHRPRSYTAAGVGAGAYPASGVNTPKTNGTSSSTNPFPHMYVSSDDDSESEAEIFKKHTRQQSARYSAKPPESRPNGTFAAPPPPPPPQGMFNRPFATPKAFKSKSEESINMKFSPSDWHGKFEGRPDYFAPNAQKGSSGTSPVRGRPPQRTSSQTASPLNGLRQAPSATSFTVPGSAAAAPLFGAVPPPPPGPPPTATQPPPTKFEPAAWSETFKSPEFAMPQTTVKFPQDRWAQTFQSPSWAIPQPTSSKETSPKRGSTAKPRAKANPRKAPAASNGTATDATSEPKSKYQSYAEESGDADAMDIDSNTPPVVEKPAPMGTQQPPTVEPKADFTIKPGTPIKFGPTGAVPSVPMPNIVPASPKAQENASATAQSPKRAALSTEPSVFADLHRMANIEPLAPSSGQGLSGLSADMGTTLPFESQTSSMPPTKAGHEEAEGFKAPRIPDAPPVPTPLTSETATSYLVRFQKYVGEFHAWRKNIRTSMDDWERETESNMENNWCLNRGETTKKLGFASYVTGEKRQKALHETMKLGMEMHEKALEKAQAVRARCAKSGWVHG